MEWEAPAIALDARPYGEGDAIVTVMTEDHGAHRGLVRGGASRAQSGLWQPGNFIQIRWTARLSDSLGAFRGELIRANAAQVMDDPLALAILTATCAVTEAALPEREPHPRVFDGLLRLIAHLPLGLDLVPDLVRWECVLLAELGYGLDLERCAVTGETGGLRYVSPRTGRAVSDGAAGVWASRLLPLPGFLRVNGSSTPPTIVDLCDGLRLTAHFLTRDAFGQRHRPLPQARVMLYDRLAAMLDTKAGESETQDAG